MGYQVIPLADLNRTEFPEVPVLQSCSTDCVNELSQQPPTNAFCVKRYLQ